MMYTFQKHFRPFCALMLMILPAMAQAASPGSVDDQGITTDMQWFTEIGFDHSDNIFHLSQSQETALEAAEEENIESGRFEDMESISDNILSPKFGFKYKSKSPIAGKLEIGASATYNYYLENNKRNYPEAEITLEHSAGKKGTFSLESAFLFDFFKKNYLSEVYDENGNGNIPKEERTYSSASYDENETVISYGHKFLDNKGEFLSELGIRPFIGYGNRTYNAPFSNRDRTISIGGLELAFEFMSRLDLEVTYTYESVSSPNRNELILYDETIDDTDVNDDGSIKTNAPLTTRIDRSSDRYTIEISPSLKLSKDIQLFANYKKRTTEYLSDNPLDIDHYEKTAYREKIGFGLQYDFMKSWSAELEYAKTDEDDEDDDYTESVFSVSMKYTF